MIVRHLPWAPAEVADEVEGRMRGAGGWSVGVPGGIAEWAADGDDPEVDRDGATVTAATPRGAIRLGTDGLAAFAVTLRTRPSHVRSVVLARRRPQPDPVGPDRVTYVGPDHAALRRDCAGQPLWDLGLGRRWCRFQVRTTDGPLLDALTSAGGRPWGDLVGAAGPLLLASGPHRVVDAPGARIEVYAPIPPPDGRSPTGPHTHLLPRHLASGRDLPRGVDLPPGWVPVATHHPDDT